MLIDKEEYIAMATLIFDSSYNKSLAYFIRILKLTRLPILKRNGLFMAAIQSNMLQHLANMQNDLQRVKRLLKESSDIKTEEHLKKTLLIQKQWIRVLQTIADGIAWRLYNFDRPLLRVMSENKSPGFLKKEGYNYIRVFRKILKSRKYFTIIHDLTRILRIGDFTVFYPDNKIMIYEIKEKGKKVIDVSTIFHEIKTHRMWPSRQKARQVVAQMTVINRKIDVPIVENGKIKKRLTVDIVDLDFPIRTHLSLVRKLIKEADQKIVAGRLAEEGYYVEITVGEKINAESLEYIKVLKEAAPEWVRTKDGFVIKLSNFDTFIEVGDEFPRNIVPYSIFPFTNRDCVRLMTGHLHLYVFVNVPVLKKKLEQRGWEVIETQYYKDLLDNNPSLERPATVGRDYMFSKDYNDAIFTIKREDDSAIYTGSVLLTDVLVAASSLYALDFIIDSAEAMYQNSKVKKESRLITRNYIGERKVFI